MLAAAAAAGAGGLSFSDLGEREARMPWAEADERARSCAARLRALGVVLGDRVAIVLPTSPAFATTFFGVALAGAVPVPLYPPLRLGALGEYNEATARLLASVDAALLVTLRTAKSVLTIPVKFKEVALP
jgi:acyl-CoA synthetase (AMP-forming)/AMP-acid ligase II